MIASQTLLFALLGGVLPALLWLWFWLKEDKKSPEPRGLIFMSFVAGMMVVPLVIPFQQFAATYFFGIIALTSWAATEEILKFLAAWLFVLRRKEMNEPIDAVIYMITIALGFSAFENALYLNNPLGDGNIIQSILTGNLRFMGAMLLHTLASATIGVAIALSFYKSKIFKRISLAIGIILAIVLHTLFNFFIILTEGEKLLTIFLFVWAGIIIIILFFEKIKRIRNPQNLFIKTK